MTKTNYGEMDLVINDRTGRAQRVRGGADRDKRIVEMGTTEPRGTQKPRAGAIPVPSLIAPIMLALTGQVPSGKNQVQLLWRHGKVHRYPNKTFTNWRATAGLELLEQERPALPLSAPIRLTCDYWPGNRIVRDVSGQLDALFSLLVYAHILKNDGLIYEVIWRRHELNKQFPKVVMEIESC